MMNFGSNDRASPGGFLVMLIVATIAIIIQTQLPSANSRIMFGFAAINGGTQAIVADPLTLNAFENIISSDLQAPDISIMAYARDTFYVYTMIKSMNANSVPQFQPMMVIWDASTRTIVRQVTTSLPIISLEYNNNNSKLYGLRYDGVPESFTVVELSVLQSPQLQAFMFTVAQLTLYRDAVKGLSAINEDLNYYYCVMTRTADSQKVLVTVDLTLNKVVYQSAISQRIYALRYDNGKLFALSTNLQVGPNNMMFAEVIPATGEFCFLANAMDQIGWTGYVYANAIDTVDHVMTAGMVFTPTENGRLNPGVIGFRTTSQTVLPNLSAGSPALIPKAVSPYTVTTMPVYADPAGTSPPQYFPLPSVTRGAVTPFVQTYAKIITKTQITGLEDVPMTVTLNGVTALTMKSAEAYSLNFPVVNYRIDLTVNNGYLFVSDSCSTYVKFTLPTCELSKGIIAGCQGPQYRIEGGVTTIQSQLARMCYVTNQHWFGSDPIAIKLYGPDWMACTTPAAQTLNGVSYPVCTYGNLVSTATQPLVIEAVNDAPVINNFSPTDASYAVNNKLLFKLSATSAGIDNQYVLVPFNALSISDVDIGTSPLQISFWSGYGQVQLQSTVGIQADPSTPGIQLQINASSKPWITISPTGMPPNLSPAVIQCSISDCNKALNGLIYQFIKTVPGTITTDTVTIKVNDQGASGQHQFPTLSSLSGPQTAQSSFSVTISNPGILVIGNVMFSSDGSLIYVTFQEPTNRAGTPLNTVIPCSEKKTDGTYKYKLFADADVTCTGTVSASAKCLFGEGYTCIWTSDSIMTVTLGGAGPFQDPTSNIVPGSFNLNIVNFDAINFSAQSDPNRSIRPSPNEPPQTILGPTIYTLPIASITSESGSLLDTCNGDALNADSSIGSANRDFTYIWKVVSVTNTNLNIQNSDAALINADISVAYLKRRVDVKATSISASTTMILGLTVTNFLQVSSNLATVTVAKSGTPLPTIQIPTSLFSLVKTNRLTISAVPSFSTCTQSSAGVVLLFSWSQYFDSTQGANVPLSGYDFSTQVSSSINFPANTFQPKTQYLFLAKTWVSGVPGNFATAVATVVVGTNPLVAFIAGGNQAIGTTQNLFLDASSSTDPDGVAVAMSYAWTCSRTNGDPCPSVINTILTAGKNAKSLTIVAFTINSAYNSVTDVSTWTTNPINIVVTVGDLNDSNRLPSSYSIIVTLQPGASILTEIYRQLEVPSTVSGGIVTFEATSTLSFAASSYFFAILRVSATIPITAIGHTWVLLDTNSKPVPFIGDNPLVVSTTSDGTASSISIVGGTFADGRGYIIQDTVIGLINGISKTSVSQLSFNTYTPPNGGNINVQPLQGDTNTDFTLTASLWVTDLGNSLSKKYSFYCKLGDSTATDTSSGTSTFALAVGQDSNSLVVKMPAGSGTKNYLQVWVVVTDTRGASGTSAIQLIQVSVVTTFSASSTALALATTTKAIIDATRSSTTQSLAVNLVDKATNSQQAAMSTISMLYSVVNYKVSDSTVATVTNNGVSILGGKTPIDFFTSMYQQIVTVTNILPFSAAKFISCPAMLARIVQMGTVSSQSSSALIDMGTSLLNNAVTNRISMKVSTLTNFFIVISAAGTTPQSIIFTRAVMNSYLDSLQTDSPQVQACGTAGGTAAMKCIVTTCSKRKLKQVCVTSGTRRMLSSGSSRKLLVASTGADTQPLTGFNRYASPSISDTSVITNQLSEYTVSPYTANLTAQNLISSVYKSTYQDANAAVIQFQGLPITAGFAWTISLTSPPCSSSSSSSSSSSCVAKCVQFDTTLNAFTDASCVTTSTSSISANCVCTKNLDIAVSNLYATSATSTGSGIGGNTLAGIIVGCIVGGIIIVAGFAFFIYRKKISTSAAGVNTRAVGGTAAVTNVVEIVDHGSMLSRAMAVNPPSVQEAAKAQAVYATEESTADTPNEISEGEEPRADLKPTTTAESNDVDDVEVNEQHVEESMDHLQEALEVDPVLNSDNANLTEIEDDQVITSEV